ncbi:MAG: signal peptide peptidase SppA [Candidatus Eisenbacteria sp.]|nr:signal peptide peptidase SppA [Candidatus Eisenbacteria bacterium]
MKRFLLTFLAVIAAHAFLFFLLCFLAISLMGAALMGRAGKPAEVPKTAYLIQEIPPDLPEFIPSSDLPFPPRPTSHTDILENLEKARVDERIQGVVLKFDMPQMGWGKLQELRERIHQLRDAGKPVWAYTTFATNKGMYLASACDSIFVHPDGFIWLTGFNAERIYARRLLDRLGIESQVSQIKEYKAMAEMVLREDMSREARENASWLLEDLFEEFLSTLSHDRGVDRSLVNDWLETGQFDAREARERGIIDRDLLWEEIEERLGGGMRAGWSVDGDDYAEVPRGKLHLKGSKIAVVHGVGTIAQGESGWVFPLGVSMGDETMVAALQEAIENDAVKGILLRLDTPGGLTTASDRIGRMVEKAASEKPLVVSMVDVNASGGYMVSYRCSTLVALPNSIVGSIGSISMKPNLTGMLEKVGITVDRVTVGPHATMLSTLASFTDEEFARLEELHWRTYSAWVEGVAHYRGMTLDEVDHLARGRVFTGRQAVVNGLIDELGGFDRALELLKQQAGIDPESEVTFIHLPKQKGFLERLAEGDLLSALHVALSGFPSGEPLNDTVAFWKRGMASNDALALLWWQF